VGKDKVVRVKEFEDEHAQYLQKRAREKEAQKIANLQQNGGEQ
jgi:hypothetical protein